jgi:hypothetical protein
MITKEEMDAMVEEELKRLGVGSTEFKRKCQELDDMIERAKAHFFTNKSDDDLTSEGQDEILEKGFSKKTNDIQLLDDLGEIRHLLEKASNSLDSFQYRYKLMFSLDDDAETKDWFFKQRKDMELGLSIISDYITTACEKIHLIEKEKTAK